MNEVRDRGTIIRGYLTWCFLLGIFLIPISMVIFTFQRVQTMTDWTSGWSMILGFMAGLVLTLGAAVPFEHRSR